MTLIVGIRCTDGVVIGTDSAMTFGPSPQQETIQQTYGEKIDIVEDRIIIAGTGAIGLGQRFVDSIHRLWGEGAFKSRSDGSLRDKQTTKQRTIDAGVKISNTAISGFLQTHANKGRYGALVAIPVDGSAELVEFGVADMQPEVKTEANWYASMGMGQPVADPLLGFVRSELWENAPPDRQGGVFAATLVLKLACQMAPSGVAEPLQMATLEPDPNEKGRLKARLFSPEKLLEHEQAVEVAMAGFRESVKDALSGKIPPPDSPPSVPNS